MIPRAPLPPNEAPYPNEDLPDPDPSQGLGKPEPDEDLPEPEFPDDLEPVAI